MKTSVKLLAFVAVAAVAGCCKAPLPPVSQPPQGAVAGPSAARPAVIEVTPADFAELAEQATRKLLDSALVAGWVEKRPRVLLAEVRNASADPTISTQDIRARIGQVLGDANTVRLVGQATASFDYVLRSELTAIHAPGAKTKGVAGYRLELQLFTMTGEMSGQWCATLSLADGRKSCP